MFCVDSFWGGRFVCMDLPKKKLYLLSERSNICFPHPVLRLRCYQFVIVISPTQGCWGFISTSPKNTSHYWAIHWQQTKRRGSDINLIHKQPDKNSQPVHKKQGMLSPKNTTIFSRFSPQWEQNANLQPASLWSIKGYLRWIIYGHIVVVLNPVKSTEEPTLYCWRAGK